MMPDCLSQLIHEFRRCFATVLARCRLHHICNVDRDSEPVVLKTRRAGSGVAIRLGNLYLQLQKCDVEILGTAKWIRWENAVQSEMNLADRRQENELSARNSHTLTRRYVLGSSLREILKDDQYSDDLKFSAIGWAVNSLFQLHRRRADWGSGVIQSVSHGDATVNNVIVDVNVQKAIWIDFDMRHLPQLPELDRHADDLRAFVFSAAVYLPVSRFPRLAELVIACITDRGLLFRFRERLGKGWGQLNSFQLAQASLSWNAKNLLTELLNAQPHRDVGLATVQ